MCLFKLHAIEKVQDFNLIWLGPENDHGARIIGKPLHFSLISQHPEGGQAAEDSPRIFARSLNKEVEIFCESRPSMDGQRMGADHHELNALGLKQL